MPPGHPIIPLKSNKFNMSRRIGNKVYCAIEPLLVSDSFVVYHISLCVRCLFLMHVTRVAFGLPFALSLVFSLIMVKPNKTSKCPGCKVLKSAHDFGTSGKHFPGPTWSRTTQHTPRPRRLHRRAMWILVPFLSSPYWTPLKNWRWKCSLFDKRVKTSAR